MSTYRDWRFRTREKGALAVCERWRTHIPGTAPCLSWDFLTSLRSPFPLPAPSYGVFSLLCLDSLLDWLPALELNSSGVLAGEQAEQSALGPTFISHWGLSEAGHAWSYWLQTKSPESLEVAFATVPLSVQLPTQLLPQFC